MGNGEDARGFRFCAATLISMSLAGIASSLATACAQDETIEICKVGDLTFELVRIPAGRFLMGSQSGDSDERPVHEVRIGDGLYMGRTEVTFRQFRAFVEATGYKTDAERAGWAYTCPLPGLHGHQRDLDWRRPGFEPTDDHPVVVISRNDALAFCQWLSEQTGRAFRLPTEAEWEYAARADRQDDSAGGAGDAAWYEENASDSAHPVGAKRANAWGLHDMRGNAWEWCLDVWRADYRDAAADGSAGMYDPVVPQVAWRYVLRGGSWASPVRQLSFSYRARGMQNFCRPDTGFRIVLPPADSGSKTPRASVREEKGGHGTCARDQQTGRTILTAHDARFEFVRIPAGEFLMGGTSEIEKPVHQVRIGYAFEMGVTEVTVAQFRAFIKATDYVTDGEKEGFGWLRRQDQDWQSEDGLDWCHATFDQSDNHPAIFISWYDAMAFCRWLSAETGQEIRLPSEAEWEHACRAGMTGLHAGELNAMGWYQYNSCNQTHRVAQKQPNAWGLYDMHGNVWEWCLDFFRTSYEGAPIDGQPRWGLDCPPDVVSRGGSFINPPGWLASGCRMGTAPSASHYNNGFRLVRVYSNGNTSNDQNHYIEVEVYEKACEEVRELVPLRIDYPRAAYVSHRAPGFMERIPNLERRKPGPPPALMVPTGTRNVALNKPVASSDNDPILGHVEAITDGAKEYNDPCVELQKGLQYVTIDLEAPYEIHAIALWHYHLRPRAYFDVIVQITNDPECQTEVTTVFNNDHDNSSGRGAGSDTHYIDTCWGRVIPVNRVQGRYVRLYSNGNDETEWNIYLEVEVYGRPVDRG